MLNIAVLFLIPAHAIECDSNQIFLVDDMANALAYSPINLRGSYNAVIDGRFDDAKGMAHATANNARLRGHDDLIDRAGMVWGIADLLGKAKKALTDQDYDAAKALAHEAANLLRIFREDM